VKSENEEVQVKNIKEIEKAWNYVHHLIQEAANTTAADSRKKGKKAVEILIKAYSEYSRNSKNVEKDYTAQPSWLYLKNAIAHYVRYDKNKCKSRQSTDFRNAVSNDVNRVIEEIKTMRNSIPQCPEIWNKALNN
jgi:hypothetical protein